VSRRTRVALFLASAGGLAVVLGFALAGLPDFGHPLGAAARIIAKTATRDRVAGNTVIDVAFDYRGFDTLIEEFMIFVSAIGAVVLLRGAAHEHGSSSTADAEESGAPDTSDAVRAFGLALAPLTVVLGIYVVTHGQLSPGGGFQGGVALAGALVFVYAAGEYVVMQRVRPVELAEVAEALGAAGFALIGFGGLIFAASFFQNFVDTGKSGSLLSGGTIPLSNVSVGVEVSGALALVLAELLGQVVVGRRGE
jgi:multicomponent Na+:H+ antiporter subunit B